MLAEKLTNVTQQERELEALRKRYNYVEGAMYDMKSAYKKNLELN